MLRRITDMPPGTLGFEAVDEVEDDSWEEAVKPARGFRVHDLEAAKAWVAEGLGG